MNAGIEAAANEYVSFLDDDDRWTPTYLEEVRAAILSHPRRPHVVLGNKHRESRGEVAPYKMIRSLDGLRETLLYKNPGVAAQNLTLRRSFHLDVHPGFRTELHSSADRAYLIDAIDCGADICLAPRAVVIKVMHEGDQMTDNKEFQKVLRFSRLYWRSMGWHQRFRNIRRLARAAVQLGGARKPPK